MKDLMVDIETLGNTSTSVITQIGACYFDRYTGEIGTEFLVNISPQSCIKYDLTMDWDTIKWWMNQPKENWSWMDDCQSLLMALNQFYDFARKCETAWAHATFDFPILMNAYKAINHKVPFHYRAMRDIRTLVDLAGLPYNKEKKNKTHNALDDCKYQVKYCVECFNALRKDEDEKC